MGAEMTRFFEGSDYYTGPPLDDELVQRAQDALGYLLPRSYLALLEERNGGVPVRRCCPTAFETSWAPDHIEISAIRGLGGKWGIDSGSGLGSSDLISEWGYPEVGLVICDMPSGGHDAVMLDYSEAGPEGEPCVVYVDEDRIPRRIANSFDQFVTILVSCELFSDS
jgi:SMI1-KNR4 cell-wall